MPGTEVRRDFIDHYFGQVFTLLVRPWWQLPLSDVRINEHGSVGVALTIILRVQRAETHRHFTFYNAFIFQDRHTAEVTLEGLVSYRRLHLLEVKYRRRR